MPDPPSSRCGGAGPQARLVVMNEPVVEMTNVTKKYGDMVAVQSISLRVERGEVLGVLGPNGAGKTTTVECAIGLRSPDSGTVRVLGMDPGQDPDAVRQRVGVQLQQAVLPNRMKVKEAMAIFAAAYARHADPTRLLEEWGLTGQRGKAFAALSGGQKQRLFIALALLGEPEVVVLDELTTGLDPAARRDTWALVQRLKDRGVTVLLVTHAMDEAETLCDRLIVIDSGRLVAEGTPDQIRGTHRSLEAAYLNLTSSPYGRIAS
jgi:ABC-2 type transport system ATP-binding protein